MESSMLFVIIFTFLVFCNGYPLKYPVRLSALKSDFDELQECYTNQEASFDLYAAVSSRLKIELHKHYVDITGTVDLTNIYDESKTKKGTPLRYRNKIFYMGNNYNQQLDYFENYKITHFNPSATIITESGTNHVVNYYDTEEFHQLVQAAISKIKLDQEKVLDLNIYKIDLSENFSAYYNNDTNSVTVPSPIKVLISDHIPLPGETLPNPVVKHGLVYDVESKLFKDGYELRNFEVLTIITWFKLRPYPYCDEAQQRVSKFWERDRGLRINNFLLHSLAIHAINMGGSSLIQFDNNIQLTLKCNWIKTRCQLHGSFTIDGDDVHDIVSDKRKKFSYKSPSAGNEKDLLQTYQVFLHPLNRKQTNEVLNIKTENQIEFVPISELRKSMYSFYTYFAVKLLPQTPCDMHYTLNYRRITIGYKCEDAYYEIVKEPGVSVALYEENTLTEILSLNDLEYNIRYSPQSDVFATRMIVNGIYGFTAEDSMEFRDEDVASDLLEMAKYFDEIRNSLKLSEYAKYYSTLAVMLIGTDEIFVAQLNGPKVVSNLTLPKRFKPWRTGTSRKTVMRIQGNLVSEFVNKDQEHYSTFYHDGERFLLRDSQGNLQTDPTGYIENMSPIRIRLAKKTMLETKNERKKIKKKIFYVRVSDMQKVVNFIRLQIDDQYCKNDRFGIYNVEIKIKQERDFIVEGKYSCPFGYLLSIEIKPNTKVFTKDGTGVMVSEMIEIGFMFDFVIIKTSNNVFKDIYAFRVKEQSEEHTQPIYHSEDKKDLCNVLIDGFKYSCFVKKDDNFPQQEAIFPF